MEKTDNATMEEILGGYTGAKDPAEIIDTISGFKAFLETILDMLKEFFDAIKEILG